MPDLVPIRRALLSVSDKTDLIPFAKGLAARGVSLISTGGTAAALTSAGLDVTPVEQVTGFPEGLDGRVKTLHPKIHGALLALRDNAEHDDFCRAHGIEPIDMVALNLYPFEKTVADPDVALSQAIENIDIRGPAMLRAASKNYPWVTVVTSPRRYDRVFTEMDAYDGATTLQFRAELAASAFAQTAEYDAAIASFLSRRTPEAFPQVLRLGYSKAMDLRYGENPHQQASLYRDPASTGQTIVSAEQLHGKELSYNNIGDGAAALEAVKALARLEPDLVGAAVIKHTTPCGMAVAPSCAGAVDAAIAGDSRAAYGGILAVNEAIDEPAAERICAEGTFFEVIVAPAHEPAALERLRSRWSNVRLLATGERRGSASRKLDYRSVPGGMLVQDRNTRLSAPEQWTHRAGPKPTKAQLRCAGVLEMACKYVASNAIVVGGEDEGAMRIFGVGAGQVDRVTACRLAVEKAGDLAKGAIAVGDAFFPFDDGPRVLVDAGVSLIVHPGGSKRDEDTFRLCEERGVTCLVTGVRHFRH
jgi:phosphoribosylaminoimidazolecarboxamide formyltransferase/IMP cyclohydrolase